ncbi:MAG: glucosaminidase domain-containing protein [Thermodesulfobacteriota bacterium]
MAEDLRILKKSISSPAEIVNIKTPCVEPVTYINAVSLKDLSLTAKKQKFFDMILPSILISKYKLKLKRDKVMSLIRKDYLSREERNYLAGLRKEYSASDSQELLKKLESHPTSIVMAQAAIETGWGSSRFFLQANNVFGIWSFDRSESRFQAEESRGEKRVYLKRYEDLISSIDDYFKTLARGPYQEFREKRQRIDNPLELIEFLRKYSELRGEYVDRLRSIITHNQMQRFDACSLKEARAG